MRGLAEKVAIVAGAAPGNIGGATTLRLAQEGMKVTAADLNEAAAQAVADQIRSAEGVAASRGFDIFSEDSYKELIDFSMKEFGGLDALLNVAASFRESLRQGYVRHLAPLDVWKDTIDVTLTGYMYGIRHALRWMMGRGSGSIVNTMSSIIWMGEAQRVSYQSAKNGLVGLTRHTAALGGKRGVRCNLVAPGVTLTEAVLRNLSEEYLKKILDTVRSPRLGTPEDTAAMVAFLFSDDSAYVNGQTILVDGGANLD